MKCTALCGFAPWKVILKLHSLTKICKWGASLQAAGHPDLQMLVNVTHEELVLTEKAHTTKSQHRTPQRTCLSSHLLVGLGVSPRSLLLLGRQMEAREVMALWNLTLEGLRVTLACRHIQRVLNHRCAYNHRVRTQTGCNPETLNTVVKCNMRLLLCCWYNK